MRIETSPDGREKGGRGVLNNLAEIKRVSKDGRGVSIIIDVVPSSPEPCSVSKR